MCVYTGNRPWKNVSLLWLCLFFIKVTNLRLTLKCSNNPLLFGDSTSQLKEIPAETLRRRAETHAWIFNRLFCCIQECRRKMKALCPSGIGTLQREREVLLLYRASSHRRQDQWASTEGQWTCQWLGSGGWLMWRPGWNGREPLACCLGVWQ